jgi:hypothetical protein
MKTSRQRELDKLINADLSLKAKHRANNQSLQ